MAQKNIFARQAVFISQATDQDAVLKEVYQHLLDDGYVKGNFLTHILEREHHYPTGLDTSTLGPKLPNVAIPHTEGEFVNCRLIVPVALTRPVIFYNMIKQEQELKVSFLFMLLDNNPDGQAKLLASVMNFLARTPVNELSRFLHLQETEKIYRYLIEHFR